MENEQIQRKIIELLIKNELAMENLYKKYSEIFTSQRLFWDEILKEEASHADWISTLYNKLDTGLINFAENRFPADAIKENIEYINAQAERAGQNNITFLEALETAMNLERGMLEHGFFILFKEDSMELQIVLEALRMGTEIHNRNIERKWKKEKEISNS